MRPTFAEIDLGAIAFNLSGVQKKVSPASVMAVVKADAYGHGAAAVSRLALQQGVSYLGVALADEGVSLRQAGIGAPLLVFAGVDADEAHFYPQCDLEATVYEPVALAALEKAARAANRAVGVHVKVDTGMGRVGVAWQRAVEFLGELARKEMFEIRGLYTHFATADERDKTYAQLQLTRFKQVIEQAEARGIRVPLKHAANSGAILDMPESYFDLVRPGVMMYGYYPSNETSESVPLQPAMTFKTRVLHVKSIERGEGVSYGSRFVAGRRTTIVTLPVGYADGYNRLLSGRGQVLIGGQRLPIAGRVCMDLTMADAGPDSRIRVGEEAVLFGRQGAEEISVQSICELLGTIPYEVTCWVSKRVPRLYIGPE